MQHRQHSKWLERVIGGILFGIILLGTGFYGLRQCSNLDLLQEKINAVSEPKDLAALEKDRITLENSIYSGMVQTGGGIFLVITAIVAWKNLQATQRNVSIAAEKQIIERYSQAINHLSSSSLEVRFGGIHVLERIARESPQDHWTIMQVLTSYIQTRSPIPSESKISREIQACLAVIAYRRAQFDPQFEASNSTTRLNLMETNLHRAELRNANLSGALLLRANLSEAYLVNADFSQANLNQVIFSRSLLNQANLSRARLVQANLTQANLSEANLTDAILEGANLQGADFRNAIGLKVDQIKAAQNWEAALFDADFRSRLLA